MITINHNKYPYGVCAEIEDLIGKTITKVEHDDFEILLYCKEGIYRFYHNQECCEDVSIDDICGDIEDLCGKVLLAEERTSLENPEGVVKENQESFTWTFYHFVTDKGYVDIRWYGESNGYYSEGVTIKYYPSDPSFLGRGYWVSAFDAQPMNEVPVLCRIGVCYVVPTPQFYGVCIYHERAWYFRTLVKEKGENMKDDCSALMKWTQLPRNWQVNKWRQIEDEASEVVFGLKEVKKFDIWAEGYCYQGMEGIPEPAQLIHAKVPGTDFIDACMNWARLYPNEADSYGGLSIRIDQGQSTASCWGCRLFPTEEEARKHFG